MFIKPTSVGKDQDSISAVSCLTHGLSPVLFDVAVAAIILATWRLFFGLSVLGSFFFVGEIFLV